MASSGKKQPVVFVSHGGGPSFFMSAKEMPLFKAVDKDSPAADYMRSMAKKEGLTSHKAILVVSAHWEEAVVTVQTTPKPDLYFDYYGFPDNMYKLKWPATGAPDLANRTRDLLESKGIKCATNEKRGYDHGVFVPLKLIFPEPKVSLDASLSTERHLALGEALTSLREEGVLIIGSGFTTHRGMGGREAPDHGKNLQVWLHDVLKNPDLTPEERRARLASCHRDPRVQEAHPRIEHFLPLLVVMAAGGYKPGKVLFSVPVFKGGLLEHYMIED
ncbi:hypothetical protein BaRGS_00010245 [Batillaria attramentaria]|uniref:Extradiol ring-cleavage dioxygenase class III enzyme subunit B domain-containing protein n=1 Tax=Batillaria attramentaria TaxID=370345 RepID=A0ABD0LGN3_9CAEN